MLRLQELAIQTLVGRPLPQALRSQKRAHPLLIQHSRLINLLHWRPTGTIRIFIFPRMAFRHII